VTYGVATYGAVISGDVVTYGVATYGAVISGDVVTYGVATYGAVISGDAVTYGVATYVFDSFAYENVCFAYEETSSSFRCRL
jgi:hypothetical protein